MNENENEIRELLGAGIGEEPPIAGGPAAVFAGARSRMVRTRAVTGALSMVAVLGVAAGAVALSGGAGKPGRVAAAATPTRASSAPSSAARTTPTPTTSTIPSPTATTPPPNTTTPTPLSKLEGPGVGVGSPKAPAPKTGSGVVLMDGRSALELAKLLLPAGLVTANYQGQDSYEPAKFGVAANGSMSVDDGTGKLTTVSVGITQNNPAFAKVTDCTSEQELQPGRISDCHAVAEPDGSVVVTYRMNDSVVGANGPTKGSYSLDAVRVFQNGTVAGAAATNYFDPLNDPHNKGWSVDPSRAQVLLTTDQLVAILMDPRFALTVSADFAQQARHDLVPYKDQTQVAQ